MKAPETGSLYLGYEWAAAYCNVNRTTIWGAMCAERLQKIGGRLAPEWASVCRVGM